MAGSRPWGRIRGASSATPRWRGPPATRRRPARGCRSGTTPDAGWAEHTMNEQDRGREPDAQGAPVRRFRDAAYRPLAENLAGIRAEIDRIDEAVVQLLAERAMFVKDAARFK